MSLSLPKTGMHEIDVGPGVLLLKLHRLSGLAGVQIRASNAERRVCGVTAGNGPRHTVTLRIVSSNEVTSMTEWPGVAKAAG